MVSSDVNTAEVDQIPSADNGPSIDKEYGPTVDEDNKEDQEEVKLLLHWTFI